MSDLNNIDKLLKDNFVDFTPDAPDVWQGIQQGVQAAQATQAAGSITTAVKGTSIVVKIIAAAAIGASVITGYVLVSNSDPIVKQEQQHITKPVEALVEEKSPEKVTPLKTEQEEISQVGEQKEKQYLNVPKVKEVVTSERAPVNTPSRSVEPVIIQAKDVSQADIKVEEKVLESNIPRLVSKDNLLKEPQPKELSKPYIPTKEEEYVEPTIPNVFSPNGDGVNDKFVILIDNEQLYSLTILGKDGNLVFESNDKNNQWDGRDYKTGAVCQAGTYYMIFRYKYKDAQTEHKATGKIVLINKS